MTTDRIALWRRRSWAEWFDASVPFWLVAAGALHPQSPLSYWSSLVFSFAVLGGAVLGGAGLAWLLSRRSSSRIQGPRRKPAKIGREAFETGRAMFVAACLMAWPLTQWRLGQPTGMHWSLQGTGFRPWQALAMTLLGVVVMDAWLYWKHRLLHTRWLFPFHKGHHHFGDPTPFAGFAVGPVESLLTFWPILLLCIPEALHWAPLYFGLVIGFITLNYYLHCGVTVSWIEATLPRIGLNTSAFHNVHHSHVKANYGEAMYIWDVICKTRLQDVQRAKAERS